MTKERPYKTYSEYLRERFPGQHLQKITVDAGFSCPNRDGSKGVGGCSFCNPEAFAPCYCRQSKSIAEQIAAGKVFFSRKTDGDTRYLVYFQSYSGTYAPVEVLRERYAQALAADGVVGLIVGTRPDCLSEEVLDLLTEIRKDSFVMLEVGVESCYDRTLSLVNRGHDFDCARRAILAAAARGLAVGVHLILGLPGESEEEMLREAEILSALPIDVLKLHQLQILRGTFMADQWETTPSLFHLFSAEEYARLVARFVSRLRTGIALDRFAAEAPANLLLAPRWGLKPQAVQQMVEDML